MYYLEGVVASDSEQSQTRSVTRYRVYQNEYIERYEYLPKVDTSDKPDSGPL
jgi:hypothetical protein